jgi:hypothetical protein
MTKKNYKVGIYDSPTNYSVKIIKFETEKIDGKKRKVAELMFTNNKEYGKSRFGLECGEHLDRFMESYHLRGTQKKKSLKGKHLVAVRVDGDSEVFVCKTRKEANDFVAIIKKKFPKVEISQTVRAVK